MVRFFESSNSLDLGSYNVLGLEYDLGPLPTLSKPIRSHIRMSYNGMLERLSLYPMIKPKSKPKPKPINS